MSSNTLLQVAAYIRVSTDHHDQEESYETQHTYFTRLLGTTPSWVCAGIYSDCGISGTSREGRTGFNRLLRHCEEGRIDRIITKSISRFVRNSRDFLRALEVLKTNHVTILFEKEHLDTAIVQNDLMFTAFGAIAQEESRSISANIRWGIRSRGPRGETRNIPIYGYRYDDSDHPFQVTDSGYSFRKVQIVEDEAAVIRRIFQETADGSSYISIARSLNRDRIPAPTGIVSTPRQARFPPQNGVLKPGITEGWTARHITQIIRLERYTGDVLLQKTYRPDYKCRRTLRNHGELPQFYIRNHHPAIVSRELFLQAQTIRQINSARYARHTAPFSHPLSGRLICAHCGRFYRTRNRRNRPIWYCASTAQDNGLDVCHAPIVYESQIMDLCARAFAERFLDCSSDPEFPGQAPFSSLLSQLEAVVQADDLEQDTAFLQKQLSALSENNTEKKETLTALLHHTEQYWPALDGDQLHYETTFGVRLTSFGNLRSAQSFFACFR